MSIKRQSQRFHSHENLYQFCQNVLTHCLHNEQGAVVLSFVRFAFTMTEQVEKSPKSRFPLQISCLIYYNFLPIFRFAHFLSANGLRSVIAQLIRHHRMTTSDKMQHKKHSKRTSASPSHSLVLRKCFPSSKRYPICPRVC